MSNVDQNAKRSEIEILQQEIVRLQAEQIVAELIATHQGMTPVDSEQYKMRHFRIRVLTKRLAMLRQETDHPQFGESPSPSV
jgi:hypothetical protein